MRTISGHTVGTRLNLKAVQTGLQEPELLSTETKAPLTMGDKPKTIASVQQEPVESSKAQGQELQKAYKVGEQWDSLESLVGSSVFLRDDKGKQQEFGIMLYGSECQPTTYFDTPDLDLYAEDSTLRARGKLEGGKVKDYHIEAKLSPQPSAVDSSLKSRPRIDGGKIKSDDWQNAQNTLLAPTSGNEAVQSIREQVPGATNLQAIAFKNKKRRYLFVYPKSITRNIGHNLGRLIANGFDLGKLMALMVRPSFVISLDEVQAEGLQGAKKNASWKELEVHVFTKLPWQKKITPERIHLFQQLCQHLEKHHPLEVTASSAYQETIEQTVLNQIPDLEGPRNSTVAGSRRS